MTVWLCHFKHSFDLDKASRSSFLRDIVGHIELSAPLDFHLVPRSPFFSPTLAILAGIFRLRHPRADHRDWCVLNHDGHYLQGYCASSVPPLL